MNALVEALDGSLDVVGLDVRLAAAVALLPAAAEEVVGAAVALGERQDEAGVAAAAEDSSLEVILVRAASFPGNRPPVQDVLDTVEDFLRNQWLVSSLIFDATKRHVADVVAVAQHGGNAGIVQRHRRLVADRP